MIVNGWILLFWFIIWHYKIVTMCKLAFINSVILECIGVYRSFIYNTLVSECYKSFLKWNWYIFKICLLIFWQCGIRSIIKWLIHFHIIWHTCNKPRHLMDQCHSAYVKWVIMNLSIMNWLSTFHSRFQNLIFSINGSGLLEYCA